MNRQAIAFLTMFSLVLMLAVYYVTMPIENDKENIPVKANLQLVEKEQKWNALKEAQLDAYALIIADANSTSQDKQNAMESISLLRKSIDEEKKYKKVVTDLGYTNCHVEIEGDLMRIMVMKDTHSTSDATLIIKAILTTSNYQYIPEVSFQD